MDAKRAILIGAAAGVDEVDAVLAVMIIEEQQRKPFTEIEQIAVEAIAELSISYQSKFPTAVARSLMTRLSEARQNSEENQQ